VRENTQLETLSTERMLARMELFYARASGNSSRAVFALNEIGAPWRARLVDRQTGEHRSADYLAKNPMGKVPALVDGALHLWESNAINCYAAEKHPEAGLLPASIEGRAAVQRWLFFQAGHVSPACLPVMRATSARVRAVWAVVPDEQATAAARVELARYLPVLDAALDRREWLEGTFSLADVAYAPHLWLIDEGGFDFGSYPAVRAWLDRLLARPAWQRARDLVFG
jgi:glutathione S-transferase